MAASPSPTISTPPPPSSALSACSSIVKQVCLYDWWLVKADDKISNCRQLRVGGINSKERLGIRVFHSAAILIRHDAVTLETADGIEVNICGTINRSRTLENGFRQEVCNHFLFGFPYYWEEFVNQSFPEESSDIGVPGGLSNLIRVVPVDGLNISSPRSFDDLPGALLRDFSPIIGDTAHSELSKSMFRDILQKYGNRANNGGSLSSQNSESDPTVTRNPTDEDSPIRGKKIAAQQNYKGENDLSVTETRRKKLQKTTLGKRIGFEAHALRKGPLTRSMAHLKNSSNKKDETVLVSSLLSVPAPNIGFNGSVTGKVVSSTTQVTRRLNLRNRSVELSV